MVPAVRPRVRDSPDDDGFAAAYRWLPDATDLEPWLGWARAARPPVLYFGPGAGRLAVPLSSAGVELVGVDVHPGMVAVLGERLPRMPVIRSRWEDLDLPDRFDLVIGPSSALTGLSALRAAARHLRPGGRAGLELMNPHWLLGGQTEVRHRQLLDGRFEIEVPYPSGHVQHAEVELRWPEHVEEHLADAGLELVRLSGGDDLAASPTYFVLALLAGPQPRM